MQKQEKPLSFISVKYLMIVSGIASSLAIGSCFYNYHQAISNWFIGKTFVADAQYSPKNAKKSNLLAGSNRLSDSDLAHMHDIAQYDSLTKLPYVRKDWLEMLLKRVREFDDERTASEINETHAVDEKTGRVYLVKIDFDHDLKTSFVPIKKSGKFVISKAWLKKYPAWKGKNE